MTGDEELRRSRARVVAAADADRRRIERALHDGPLQRRVALVLELQNARLLSPNSDFPPEVSELLERLAEDVRGALAELRELAARIHPPLLVGHGLAASLRAAVAPVVVELEGEPLGTLPEAVAVAIYLSCLEAVENAAARADSGAPVRVLLGRSENDVHLALANEGGDYDAAVADSDALLARISDRLEAVGGRLTLEPSEGGGTRLAAQISLEQ